MLGKVYRRITEEIRHGVQRLGFDVVRYNELPRDLDPEIGNIVVDVNPDTLSGLRGQGGMALT